MFMISRFNGTGAIKTDATTRQGQQATSKHINKWFMTLTFNGTIAIKTDAATRQSEQVTSNNTNRLFMILTLDGTTALKTGATTRQRKQAPSNNTNEENTHNTYRRFIAIIFYSNQIKAKQRRSRSSQSINHHYKNKNIYF